MKEKELRNHATCNICKNKIGNSGLPLFSVLKIQRHGIKMDVVNRQQGLTMVLGGHAELAGIMGPDEDMTMPLMDELTLTVCETCLMDKNFNLLELTEYGEEDDE